MDKFLKFVKQLFHRKHYRKLSWRELEKLRHFTPVCVDDFEFYCIVCERIIKASKVQEIFASAKYGGWYCGYHTEIQLLQAHYRLNDFVVDRIGNLYTSE